KWIRRRSLPAVVPGPLADDLARARGRPAAVDHLIPVVLGSRGAGVVRQDAHPGPDRELRLRVRAAGPEAEDAVLLARIAHDHIGDELAVEVGDEPVATVHPLRGRAPVARGRHPAAV